MENELYILKTPENYSKDSNCYELFWKNIFMPFDVIKGLDSCPPDYEDYNNYNKNNWWVCPKTRSDICNVHDISEFIFDLPVKECETLEEAVEFCLNWRKNWLETELKKIL